MKIDISTTFTFDSGTTVVLPEHFRAMLESLGEIQGTRLPLIFFIRKEFGITLAEARDLVTYFVSTNYKE